jgi:hypothetical protein
MEQKAMIKEEVTFLLNSAIKRDTEQGKQFCIKILELLPTIETKAELLVLLRKINRTFVGIEAHGFLTQQEFEAVKRLRMIEENYKNT